MKRRAGALGGFGLMNQDSAFSFRTPVGFRSGIKARGGVFEVLQPACHSSYSIRLYICIRDRDERYSETYDP
jgi:hypothetical protein